MAAPNPPARGYSRSRGPAPTVVRVLKPLRENPTGRIDVRILEVRGERRVDLRQYVTADTFTGYTKKGLLLSGEEFRGLLEQQKAIKAALEGGR